MKCPKCGADLVERSGKHGKFFGCSTFPKCNGSKSARSEGLGIVNELRLAAFFSEIDREMSLKHDIDFDFNGYGYDYDDDEMF